MFYYSDFFQEAHMEIASSLQSFLEVILIVFLIYLFDLLLLLFIVWRNKPKEL